MRHISLIFLIKPLPYVNVLPLLFVVFLSISRVIILILFLLILSLFFLIFGSVVLLSAIFFIIPLFTITLGVVVVFSVLFVLIAILTILPWLIVVFISFAFVGLLILPGGSILFSIRLWVIILLLSLYPLVALLLIQRFHLPWRGFFVCLPCKSSLGLELFIFVKRNIPSENCIFSHFLQPSLSHIFCFCLDCFRGKCCRHLFNYLFILYVIFIFALFFILPLLLQMFLSRFNSQPIVLLDLLPSFLQILQSSNDTIPQFISRSPLPEVNLIRSNKTVQSWPKNHKFLCWMINLPLVRLPSHSTRRLERTFKTYFTLFDPPMMSQFFSWLNDKLTILTLQTTKQKRYLLTGQGILRICFNSSLGNLYSNPSPHRQIPLPSSTSPTLPTVSSSAPNLPAILLKEMANNLFIPTLSN